MSYPCQYSTYGRRVFPCSRYSWKNPILITAQSRPSYNNSTCFSGLLITTPTDLNWCCNHCYVVSWYFTCLCTNASLVEEWRVVPEIITGLHPRSLTLLSKDTCIQGITFGIWSTWMRTITSECSAVIVYFATSFILQFVTQHVLHYHPYLSSSIKNMYTDTLFPTSSI